MRCTSVVFSLPFRPKCTSAAHFLLTVHFIYALPYGSWATADQSTAVGYSVAPGRGVNTIRNIKTAIFEHLLWINHASGIQENVSDAFIQNADNSIHAHMNYRSIIDCFSCVEGIRLTTVVLGALTHWAIHTNYPCLGWSLNSIFNLHNSISHRSIRLKKSWRPKKGTTVDKNKCGPPLRISKVEKKERSGPTERRATGVSIERQGEVEGARTPLSAAMGGQYVNERLPWRWIMNEHSRREHVSPRSPSLHLLPFLSHFSSTSCTSNHHHHHRHASPLPLCLYFISSVWFSTISSLFLPSGPSSTSRPSRG